LAEREGEEGWRQIAANPDVYDSLIDDEAMAMAEAMANHHREGMNLFNQLGTQEEFDAVVDLASSNATPADVPTVLARRISGLFTGRSAADYQTDAVNSIQQSTFAQNARAMNAFMEDYEKTGDPVAAFNFGRFVESLEEPTDRTQVTESIDTANVTGTGVLLEIKKITETDRFTGDVKERIDQDVIFDLNTDSPELASKKMLDDAFDRFNLVEQSRQDMTSNGQELLYKTLRDEHGIDLANITTFSEYETAAKVYGDIMIQADGLYIKDPVRVAERQGIIDIMTAQMELMEGLPARLAAVEDPDQADAIIREVGTQYAQLIRVIDERYVPEPYNPNR